MHLPDLPTIFVKNGEERKAYFTVQARELVEAGWVQKGEEKVVEKKPVEKRVAEKKPAAPARVEEPKASKLKIEE